MRNFDFEPFFRSSIGFDRMFELLDRGLDVQAEPAYPPTTSRRLVRMPIG